VPIVDVEVVGPLSARRRAGLAARLADVAALALATPPGRMWVRVRSLARTAYAEDGGGPPPGGRPVFVRLLRRAWPAVAVRRREARALTEAVAKAVGRPAANVHVLYEPPGEGRAAFGGELMDPPSRRR